MYVYGGRGEKKADKSGLSLFWLNKWFVALRYAVPTPERKAFSCQKVVDPDPCKPRDMNLNGLMLNNARGIDDVQHH